MSGKSPHTCACLSQPSTTGAPAGLALPLIVSESIWPSLCRMSRSGFSNTEIPLRRHRGQEWPHSASVSSSDRVGRLVGYLTLRAAGQGRSTSVKFVGGLFTIPFYAGVVSVCVGILVFAIVRASRRPMNAALGRPRTRANVGRGMTLTAIPGEDPVHEAYRLAV